MKPFHIDRPRNCMLLIPYMPPRLDFHNLKNENDEYKSLVPVGDLLNVRRAGEPLKSERNQQGGSFLKLYIAK